MAVNTLEVFERKHCCHVFLLVAAASSQLVHRRSIKEHVSVCTKDVWLGSNWMYYWYLDPTAVYL